MLRVTSWFERHVKVVYSPFREMLLSLHVLSNPTHHVKRLEWAENVLNQMDQEEKEILYEINEKSDDWLHFIDWCSEFQAEVYVEEGIEKLRVTDTKGFQSFFPKLEKELVCNFLYQYHQRYFARELFQIEPWLERSVYDVKETIKQNPLSLSKNLHPRFLIHEKEIIFLKARTWQYRYEDLSAITLYPSTFVAPHLLIDNLISTHIKVYYEVEIASSYTDEVPKDLLRILQAISDETRLKMLRDLSFQSFCTQQLTERYSLTKSTVSNHLKMLESTGLIQKERKGYYVFYKTNRERLEQIRVDLDQFMDFPIVQKLEEGRTCG
ncbi:ArsR/SmtB family transcription factor [Bacillus pseudomycoides]|uniref:ArsR/SmtB family transcription factor n=1 Tax=Bacillus pseudomycoides TaxID=64104 RepID=UPI000BEF667D|nr:metalloregulator ArsR/SmtB family transcription factor [Bacillus pseudomycoides]PEO42598.1 transcriptional regulator [Bacillus pseudomycoides]